MNARILVVDDHEGLRRGMALALREGGHEVDECASASARRTTSW